MESKLLSEKSRKIIGLLLLEPQIRANVFETIDHSEKYKIYTIKDDGSVILGVTKFIWWNKLIGCQTIIPFESFCFKVWDALVNLSEGINQKAILEGLSREIVMNSIRKQNYDWLTERLYNIATMVAQKSQLSDGERSMTDNGPLYHVGKSGQAHGAIDNSNDSTPRELCININGVKKRMSFVDAIGDPTFQVEIGVTNVKKL